MVIGRKKAAEGARCRRHPRHRQGGGAGAGVCALCLRDRLSHLTSPSSSASASLPSVVRGEEEDDYEASSSCCSDSSSEASSGASSAASGSSSPWAAAFHQEMMTMSGKPSLLMRHERVLMDGDEVASVVRRMRERRRLQATSFWTKLMHATLGGGKSNKEGCSMAHSKTMGQERSTTAAKWILF